MLRKTSCLLALVLLCGVGQAGASARADEPVKTGEKRDTLLYVRTDPPGAKVFLNGKELGTSDGLFRVEPGSGTIFLELEGCKPGERPVIIKANAITRVELSLEPQAEEAQFIGHLPQGTVELVGITNYPPTEQSQWWKPDGSAVHLDSFVPEKTQLCSLSQDQKPLTFLVRFRDLPADTFHWAAWDIEPTTSRWVGTEVRDDHGKTVPNCEMFSAELGPSAETASLRVGFSMGPWDTVITQKPDSLGTSSFSRDGQQWTVAFQEATAGAFADSTRVTFTTTVGYGRWGTRLLAMASDGSEHVSSLGYKGGDGTADFRRLPLSSIKEFRFQVRPFHWVEFKNVSLQSGQKTDVKVVSLNDSANTEK